MSDLWEVSWDWAALPSLENCTLCRSVNRRSSSALQKKAGCHRSHPCGEWPCLLRTTWRGSGLWGSAVSPAPRQNACSGCSRVGCGVLLRNAEHSDHQLGWKTNEGSHLFVTSHRTRSWLLSPSTLLFGRRQFKNLLWRFFHACLCQSLLRSCS